MIEAQVKEVHKRLEHKQGGDTAEGGAKPSGKWPQSAAASGPQECAV